VVMLLARPEGAGPGTRGVGLFLMPRRLEDGSQNHYRIVRLKDKLGTRSMASGEIKLEGAIAYAVGKLDRGFVQMAEMVNSSRLSNGVKSTALMRRAHHDAMTVAQESRGVRATHHRPAAGAAAIDEDHAATEQALSMSFLTAMRSTAPRPAARTRRAAAHPDADPEIPRHPRRPKSLRRCVGDARRHRLHRGIRTARLLRDAHLGSIWEGTGNIVASMR
jgi:Acyl-CoA dehydrogenases